MAERSVTYGPPPLRRAWYVAGRARRLRRGPIRALVAGVPLVLFRSHSGVAALVDRCPHRGVPLSLGRVQDGLLQCRYHGWRFDETGACRGIPASVSLRTGPAHDAEARPAVEQQGFVWVCPAQEPPSERPHHFERLDDPSYGKTLHEATMPAGLLATAENILDVPHTAYLHGGWFRREPRHIIRAVVTRDARAVQAEFQGERPPGGLLGRLLAPGAREVEHRDRFLLPAIAEVEYRLGNSHLLISSALTPVDEEHTRLTSVACLRLPWGSQLIASALTPVARRVLAQDAFILRAMSEAQRRFPEAKPAFTEVDLLGSHIARLLRDAARGEATPPARREVELRT